MDDGPHHSDEANDIPHGFEAKEAGGQAQPSGTGVMQDITACSADTKSGTEWGQALRRCLGFPSFACALLYEAGLRDAMVLGKCEQSEQGAVKGEFTVLGTLSYPETVSTHVLF